MKKETQAMIEVMQAYINGKPIEFSEINKDRWFKIEFPLWTWSKFVYRVRSIPDVIPWTHIIPSVNFVYRDEQDRHWASRIKPTLRTSGDRIYYEVPHSSVNEFMLTGIVIKVGTLPSHQSLSIRPGYEENDLSQ